MAGPKPHEKRILSRLANGEGLMRAQTLAPVNYRTACYRFNDLDKPLLERTILRMKERGWVDGYDEIEITEKGRALL